MNQNSFDGQYIFCASTGRCGTGYLSTLLAACDDINSYHEADPLLNGEEMRRSIITGVTIAPHLQREKLRSIEDLRSGRRFYAESSHLFIKSFGWFVPEQIDRERMCVIQLRRDRDEIARSLMSNYIHPWSPLGWDWVLPTGSCALFKACGITPFRDYGMSLVMRKLYGGGALGYKAFRIINSLLSEDIIYRWAEWYIDATADLIDAWRLRFPHIRVLPVSLLDIKNPVGARQLIERLGLQPGPAFDRTIGLPLNTTGSRFGATDS